IPGPIRCFTASPAARTEDSPTAASPSTLKATSTEQRSSVGSHSGPCVEDGCGVVYKLTYSGGRWKEHVIHAFTGGKDGYGPGAGVTLDGNIYGMTPTGGADGLGVIYQLTPARGNNWKLHVIHTFTGGKDGATGSAGRLILD